MSDRHSIQPYPLRLQPDLRAKLEEEAKASGRSLHAEIVSRLGESLVRPPPLLRLTLPQNAPIYWEESQLLAAAKHLHRTERTLEGKAVSEIRELLIARIKEVFRDSYRKTYQGEVECLWRGAYALAFLGRGRGDYSDGGGIYITIYIIPDEPGVVGFGELPPDQENSPA